MSELHYLHDVPSPYDAHSVPLENPMTGPVTSRIEENAQAPMYLLPVGQNLEGYYWKGAFSLVGGVVLHEYEGTPIN